MNIVKKYTNGEVTVVWKPALCIHATTCWKELPEVFNPKIRPWINPLGADTQRIIEQVKRCPTDALTYFMNAEQENSEEKTDTSSIVATEEKTDTSSVIAGLTRNPQDTCEVEVLRNGPLVVSGHICIKQDGCDDKEYNAPVAFCRCAKSKNQPYCDGSHDGEKFE